MPSQIFKITRAPEAQSLDPRMVRSLLWRDRRDSEWEVTEEIDTEHGRISATVAAYCERLRCENEALRDAIDALHDLVSGGRSDYDGVIAMLNGAMKIAGPTGARQYECPNCGRTYASRSRQTETMKCHCGEEVWPCRPNVPDEGRGIPRPSPSDCSMGGDA